MTAPPSRLLSLERAARSLGVDRATLRRWSAEGLIAIVALPDGRPALDAAHVARVRRALGFPFDRPAGWRQAVESDQPGGRHVRVAAPDWHPVARRSP